MRRDATRVIFDILALGSGSSKTQITFKANLSHKLAEKYTAFLVKKGLLEIKSDFEGARYCLTPRGNRLLALLQEVERELSDFYMISLATETRIRDPVLRTHPSFDSERERVPMEVRRASPY